MAFQTRGRDPLFDSDMQASIERRGKELAGMGLIVVGLLIAMMVGSYSPDDPSWMSASDAPVQNWLGRFGASFAAPLFMIIGLSSWGFAIVAMAWGLRLALHRGEDRAFGRVIFAPIWIALLAVYCATLVPDADWPHRFGMGGLFGDTVLGTILGVVPVGPSLGLKVISLLLAVPVVALGLFVTGFDKVELRRIGRYMLVGLIMGYALMMQLLGKGAVGAARTAVTLQQKQRDWRDARRAMAADSHQGGDHWVAPQQVATGQAQWSDNSWSSDDDWAAPEPTMTTRAPRIIHSGSVPPMTETDAAAVAAPQVVSQVAPQVAPQPEPAQPARTGIMGRLPSLIRRADPQPELVEQEPMVIDPEGDLPPGDDRIKARIAEIVRSRVRTGANAAPSVTAMATQNRRKGPDPLVLDTSQRPEPPLTTAAPAAPQFAMTEPPLTAPVTQPQVQGQMPNPQMAGQPYWGDPAPVAEPAPEPIAEHTGFGHQAVEPQSYHFEGAPQGYAPVSAPTMPPVEQPVPMQAEVPVAQPIHVAHAAPMMEQPVIEQPVMQPAPQPVMPHPLPVAEPRQSVVQHPPKKTPAPSARAQAEAQPSLQFEDLHAEFELPPLNLLANPANIERHVLSDEALEENARMLENVLDDYGVKGEIVSVRPGPVVTMYELEPAPGLKASRVIGLADDIARSMSALSARVSTVPGRSVIGIELPNEKREMVSFREILSTREYGDGNHALPLALGKDIGGDPVVANLAKMPHLLIAGTTGSGKSVAINTMILSLLYKLTPEDCRLIMIDPKMLELSVYDGIPHLLSPVVTDPKKAVVALKWVVGEMEDRYRKMSKMGVRNINGYNGRVQDALDKGEMFSRTVQTGFDDDTGDPVFETEEFEPKKMPYIVVIVDEMADLMMVAGKEIEACIQRLAQMARASGIHLIMATQRPSVDVITGTIKANFPTRISFQVTSKIDSRTILGEMGAEQLLGMGDMLYMAGGARITRCHGPFVSDEEVEEIVNHLKSFGPPEYVGGVVEGPAEENASDIDAVLGLGGNTDGEDALYDQAVAIVVKDRKCSTSYIQRKLGIGYNKAARLVEQMEESGLVSPANHVGKREILVPEQQ